MNEIILSGPIGVKDKGYFENKYQIKKLPTNNILFIEGEKVFYMYYIIKGRVKIYKTNELGKEYITHIYQSGDFFGHTTLLRDEMHDDNAVTLEETEFVKFSKNDFFDLVSNDKNACIQIMRNLSSLLKDSEDRLIRIAYNSARKKIADAVLLIAKKYCTNVCENHPFPVSRKDLSALSGISPESVSRTLTDFKKEGLIEAENGQISILNSLKLETLKN